MRLQTTYIDTLEDMSTAVMSLRRQGIGVRGPFVVHNGIYICVIGKYILRDIEMVELMKKDELTREGIFRLFDRIDRTECR